MKDIIVIGGGGHAKVMISIIKKLKTYKIIGYTDITNKGNILGVSYIGTDEEVLNYSKQMLLALGIGQIRNLESRRKIVYCFTDKSYKFATLVSPDSVLNEDVSIGSGSVIMDGVVINSGTRISRYTIINTKASIDHDCEIGDFVHVAPNVTVCGDVKIGNCVFIGAGSTIVNGVSIPDNTFIKAHSLCK